MAKKRNNRAAGPRQVTPLPVYPGKTFEVVQPQLTAPSTVEATPVAGPSELTLRECFIQASNNARIYMDLRFKHFGTFVVLTGLLGSATFKLDGLSELRPQLVGVAWVLSILFWFLDYRTSQYLSDELHRIRAFKERLCVPSTNVPKHFVLLRASVATNLIFLTTLLMWGLVLLKELFPTLHR